ncbi:MAG: DUF4465 domain-containing protein [Saprospiraceae bacterium]|nr:DUF4465 domain-containing protein [Saprospiraceae bacterium]MCF8248347.1 DUF4465 domain-containing protein [Saprospiraceae bacterium]MCF8280214.1 DUF4465 domain-containing protein [Bacteroidales bacterium]MCF8309875.1 DUF4465 domain-containing protein [Saprospiraceae bacterium]MCF8438794.1 DUF4465 domain-containing protein [Saprospiraceae bacterium]
MKSLNILLLVFFTIKLAAQTVADFENFNLSVGSYINDAGSSHVFQSGNIELPNSYVDDPNFPYWSGWAISAATDVTTPGFQNEFSAITGGGVNGSNTYSVSYIFGSGVMNLTGNAVGGVVQGLYLTNNTYAYLSMLEGDGFAKRFGGENGNDPDFFKVTIRKYLNGQIGSDSVEFYLADYRFTDNSQDYIVNNWTWVDLTPLGNVDYLEFTVASSDVSTSGINTPTYLCVDDVTTTDMPSATKGLVEAVKIKAWPNPVSSFLKISWEATEPATIWLSNIYGETLLRKSLLANDTELDVSDLTQGVFTLHVAHGDQVQSQIFIKI